MVTVSFLLTSSIILLTPGPTNTILAASGAALGFRRALFLPLAEALGYAIAISFFVALTSLTGGLPWALPIMKAIASLWLILSAVRLWTEKVDMTAAPARGAFFRVLFTTLLNPKAMLVGTMLIPPSEAGGTAGWVGAFVTLSVIAGMGWVMLGSLLPRGVRRHAYKGAAVVLGGFSMVAAASALA
ncbi:threonine transporter [Sinorhizobium sp. BG8]|uniref:LysE family translocator n=1 Tax=Sinorhizobium sp. BG8 TaxID=2613773 RepID=UPI00193E9317|nr:threonine transporter [Sinorhizobium sp. BG8]QRM54437.1 threonine transporter [Sinorhizobium sp. BG8]